MNSATTQNSLILVVLLLTPALVQNQRSPFLPRRDCEVVDLIFILDRSWSLRSPDNFQKELNFVSDVVSVLDFAKSRASVITFSDNADINIRFNDYLQLNNFQSAVRTLPWVGGNTYTHKAIELMLQEYNQNIRDRAGITTIGVIVTDGGSTDPYKLEDVVKVVHNDRIEMFAIGVGDEVNQQELEMLASGYDHVYLLNNLNSLNEVRDKLTARFCRGTPAPSTEGRYNASCINKPAHVLLVMEASPPRHQLEPQDVDTVAEFVTHLTRSIGQSHVFKLAREGSLKNVLTFTNVKNFLRSLRHSNLSTGSAYDRNILEPDLKPGSVNIVVITGLPSQMFLVQAPEPERYATHTFTVGIGKNVRREKLEQLVPNSKTFLVQNQSMSTKVVKEIMASGICLGCEDVDLYFVLDSSNSIGPATFQRECKLAADLVSLMDIRNGHSSITTVSYSDTPELHAYSDAKQFSSLVLTHQWKGGNTMTHHALDMTLKASEGKASGRRQVGILMSDGASTSPDRTERAASKIHRSGLEMFVIGMGENVNIEELEMIASSPSRMYMEKSVTASHLTQAICNGAVNDEDKNIPDNNLDCREAFDIVFVLDSSWSLTTEKNFKKELHFVMELVDNLQFDFNRASASVITYSDQATEYFFQNKKDFASTVPNLPWLGGNTFTDIALSKILQNVERKMNSIQSGSDRPLVVVVISDGGSTSPYRLEKVVSRLKQFKFLKLFAIGVGFNINLKELEMIASDPSDSHMFMVDDLEVNNKILKSLLTSQICRDAVYLSVVSPPASVRCTEHVDLVFMLDSSSSLGVVNNPDVNFLKEVAFVIDVIKLGNIDFQQSRVSVITYSDVVILRQYFSEDELLSGVLRLPFLGGNTYTHTALQLMLDELKYLKAVSKGKRPAIGIVLTDGHSTIPKLTSSAAKNLHDEGFRIVVFGVGPHADIRALTEIASLPKNDNLFLLDALDWPTSFLPSLHNSSPPQDFTDCSQPVDLVFVLDSSWSLMSETNFQKELKFVAEVVSALSSRVGQSRLSVITFSDNANMSIPLTMYQSTPQFINKVLNLPWNGGNTYTDRALEMMYKQFDSYRESGRRSVGVVITDGGSTNPFRTTSVVRKVKERGIEMFAIGVGMSINKKELQMIASEPVNLHEFMVDDLDGLKMLRSTLVSRLCPGPTRSPPRRTCTSEPADIFFIVDKSSSLQSQANFDKELQFIARVLDNVVIGTGPDDSRAGLISFSTNATLEFGLSTYSNDGEVRNALLALSFTTGDTYTHKAFNIMLDEFARTARRDPRVRKIGFIVTDGQSTDPNSLKNSIARLDNTDIEMYAVGCCESTGAGTFNSDELKMMASKPTNVFKVDELDDLRTISVELNLKRCRVV